MLDKGGRNPPLIWQSGREHLHGFDDDAAKDARIACIT
jgi:hypothetical protein